MLPPSTCVSYVAYTGISVFCCHAGDVVCPKCQHIFSFNVAEPFFRSELSAADQAKSRDLFFKSKPLLYAETYASLQENAVPAGELEPAVFAGILEHLDLHGIAAAAVEMVPPVLCDPQKKSLYFAMRGANADDVGHKELVRNPISGQVETITSPESSSYGVVTFAPSTKRGVRDTKTAIIVLTLRDALALRTEKSNGGYKRNARRQLNEASDPPESCKMAFFCFRLRSEYRVSAARLPLAAARMPAGPRAIPKADPVVRLQLGWLGHGQDVRQKAGREAVPLHPADGEYADAVRRAAAIHFNEVGAGRGAADPAPGGHHFPRAAPGRAQRPAEHRQGGGHQVEALPEAERPAARPPAR